VEGFKRNRRECGPGSKEEVENLKVQEAEHSDTVLSFLISCLSRFLLVLLTTLTIKPTLHKQTNM